jgi:hypothetical protein
LAPLFELGLIELPAAHHSEAAKQLVEQLVTWSAETKAKTDLVMALWFAEIRAREVVNASAGKGQANFMPNRWLSARRRSQQIVINLNDLATANRG